MINAEQALERTKTHVDEEEIQWIKKVITQQAAEGKSKVRVVKRNVLDSTCMYLKDAGYSLQSILDIGLLEHTELVEISWGTPYDE